MMPRLAICISSILLSTLLSAQNRPDALLQSLDRYNKEYPQEKVYLHLDKPYYYSNEDLWFQVYLVAGPIHEPSPFSRNVYVELISPADTVMQRHNILIESGVGHGDFKIPKEIKSGTYTVRAYTNWMRNFDQEFFFTRKISILRPTDSEFSAVDDLGKLVVDFYPEGGNLVADLLNTVAIRVSSKNSLGVQKKVIIYDSNEKRIVESTTNQDGIASFQFKPALGAQYYAKLLGDDERFALPEINSSGYILNVDNTTEADKVIVDIRAKGGAGMAYILGQTRGAITLASQVKFNGEHARLLIDKKELLSGITQFTVFDEEWRPQSERLIFHKPNNELYSEITTDKSIYNTRDSTVLKLKVVDSSQTPIRGNFSISILDSAQVNAGLNQENIASNLLLTSDLKGYINNPGRFFSHDNTIQDLEDLDKLMMVHGWRRFSWEQLASNEFPEHVYGVEQGITLQGTLFNKEGGEPVEGGKISHVGSFNEVPSFSSTESLTDGFFVLGNLSFYDGEENFLKGEYKNGRKDGFVMLDSVSKTFPAVDRNGVTRMALDTTIVKEQLAKSIEREYIKSLYDFDDEVTDLGEVVVEGVSAADRAKKKGQYYAMDMDNMVETVAAAPTIFQVLRQRMPNLNIDGFGPNTNIELNYGISIDRDPILILDGERRTAADIAAMPPNSIQKVEIHKGINEIIQFARDGGELKAKIENGGGVIEFTSRNPDQMLTYFQKLGGEEVKTLPGGYYKAREFSAPRYFPEKPEHVIPDNRVLIHWEPLVKTDENGEAELTFFNADLPTTVVVYLEGLSTSGTPILGKHSYRVIKKEPDSPKN